MTDSDYYNFPAKDDSEILNFLEKAIKVGNALSIKTGLFPCAKHYQEELRNWAEIVSEYNKRTELK